MTRHELEDRMTVLLGGRAAESVVFQHLSTGAADDLAKATDIARRMVLRYGMDEQLGHVTYDREKPTLLGVPTSPGWHEETYSDETERYIDHAVRNLMEQAFERAVAIVKRYRNVLEKTAQVLLQKETLEKEELEALREEISPEGNPHEIAGPALLPGASKA
jgi:cell division protease FtsH